MVGRPSPGGRSCKPLRRVEYDGRRGRRSKRKPTQGGERHAWSELDGGRVEVRSAQRSRLGFDVSKVLDLARISTLREGRVRHYRGTKAPETSTARPRSRALARDKWDRRDPPLLRLLSPPSCAASRVRSHNGSHWHTNSKRILNTALHALHSHILVAPSCPTRRSRRCLLEPLGEALLPPLGHGNGARAFWFGSWSATVKVVPADDADGKRLAKSASNRKRSESAEPHSVLATK